MQGVHLLVIDLFPPGKRDPEGIHKAIWDQFEEQDIETTPNKPLTLASYDAGPTPAAYGILRMLNGRAPPLSVANAQRLPSHELAQVRGATAEPRRSCRYRRSRA
jgi:hypothetical protein